MKVTVGALSLITPDPEEQIITILTIEEFYLYDPLVSSKHDIALIQVQLYKFFFLNSAFIQGEIMFFLQYVSCPDRLFLAPLLNQSGTMKSMSLLHPGMHT